jgi:tRNA-2-methylthio-N6-dimethylallyladenosine synthase
MKNAKTFHIITFGCQMNLYDSHLMAFLLETEGFEHTGRPEDADLIIVNTCAVREHAVTRALSRIDALSSLKQKNSNLRIGVTGCIAQQLKANLLNTRPFIDFLLGPDNLHLITKCAINKPGAFLDMVTTSPYAAFTPARGRFPEAFVAAMRGCDNFCSFCIVPYVRGKERSRELTFIMQEVRKLAEHGYSRIVLLGQNVNNYRDHGYRLPQLLTKVAEIQGIQRIGFLTSHPAYFPLEAVERMKQEPKIERYVHLPVQSGSSRILRLMHRHYTRKDYLALIDTIKETIPDIAISTDIMVGFPGETEDDFNRTIDMVRIIEFDFAYLFRYSPRKLTLAGTMIDDIPEETKKDRLRQLIQVQTEITKRKSEAYTGRILDVLSLGRNRKNLLETDTISVYNKRVIVKGILETGTTSRVQIREVKGWTPIGVPLEQLS